MAGLYPDCSRAPRIRGDRRRRRRSCPTLRTGSAIFDAAVGVSKGGGGASLAGAQAFQLHDTYGFPIDLTLEMASGPGLSRGRGGASGGDGGAAPSAPRQDSLEKKTGNARHLRVPPACWPQSGPVIFTGYDEISGEATVNGAAGRTG